MGRFRSITHPFAARRQDCSRAAARLACVRHAASVQSEPGSNSSLEDFENHQKEWSQKTQLLLEILVTQVFALRHRRESPHKLPAELLKSTRAPQWAGESRRFHAITPPGALKSAPGAGAAQYSDGDYGVNGLSASFIRASRRGPT